MKTANKEFPKKVSSGDTRIDSLVSKAFKKAKDTAPPEKKIHPIFKDFDNYMPPFFDVMAAVEKRIKEKKKKS